MEEMRICVKWSGTEHWLVIGNMDTISILKDRIAVLTGVGHNRQKLLNLKYKGKLAEDSCLLSELNIKPDMKVMMMGSREEDILGACSKPVDTDDILDDLDQDDEVIAIENEEIYLQKIEKRVKEYKIEVLNEPRPGKKLLVLDIDYTLFDHRSPAESCNELMRPFLHEFLMSAYENYDIVIWSATDMKWIKKKMKLLGMCEQSASYKIMFYLDSLAMITVHTQKYGTIDVKPLGVIWGKYSQYSSKNTIMFDDIRRNFLMNPNEGLKIRPFKRAHLNRDKDRELLNLSVYLLDIAMYCDDFNELDHKKWEKYRPPNELLDIKASRMENEKK